VFGKNLIEALREIPNLKRLEIGFSKLGGIGCEALGSIRPSKIESETPSSIKLQTQVT